MLTPKPPGPDPEIWTIELPLGAGYADRCGVVRGRANPGWFGCGAVAISGEVDDGRGVELLGGDRPWAARGPAVRCCGPSHQQGGGSQESEEMGQLL